MIPGESTAPHCLFSFSASLKKRVFSTRLEYKYSRPAAFKVQKKKKLKYVWIYARSLSIL